MFPGGSETGMEASSHKIQGRIDQVSKTRLSYTIHSSQYCYSPVRIRTSQHFVFTVKPSSSGEHRVEHCEEIPQEVLNLGMYIKFRCLA